MQHSQWLTQNFVPVVILSIQDNNTKLLQQLKSGFKGTIICNRYQSKKWKEVQDPYWSNFSDFKQALCFVFENNAHGTSYNRPFLLTVKVKDYNVLINEKTLFDQAKKW